MIWQNNPDLTKEGRLYWYRYGRKMPDASRSLPTCGTYSLIPAVCPPCEGSGRRLAHTNNMSTHGRWIKIKRISEIDLWVDENKLQKLYSEIHNHRPELHEAINSGRYGAIHSFEVSDKEDGALIAMDSNRPKR